MKLVKPTALSFTSRPILLLGRQRLTLTSLVGFSLTSEAPRLIPEIALWPAIAEVTGGLIDEGFPKPRAELLVFGSCHTPNARPLPISYVRAQLGAVDKRLAVIGDRYWQQSMFKAPYSEPAPFTEMPIGWDRAFGGLSYKKNPLGRGIDAKDGRIPLPNIEHAGSLISAQSQRPEPAGFGPIDVTWPQRASLAGTYGSRYLEQEFPGFARDTDSAFFSTAPPDQRIEGFWRGDEKFVLENLHPTRARIEGALPRVAARTFVRARGKEFEAVSMRLDTVVFLPGKEIGILVFRGAVDVLEDDAADVTHVLAACEDLGAPRDAYHYRVALESRLDKDQSPLLALKEDDMLPAFAKGTGLEALLKDAPSRASAGADAIKKKLEAQVRTQLESHGVNADEALAKRPPPPPELAPLDALGAGPDLSAPGGFEAFAKAIDAAINAASAHAKTSADKALADARQEAGRDLPVPPSAAGPPEPQAPRILVSLAESGASPPDPALVAKLHDADAQALAAYRSHAHFMDAPPGQDLSDRDLRAQPLRDAMLVGANLSGTNIEKADLSGAVLAHASLRATNLEGALLTGANLGSAQIDGARFDRADLKKAVLSRARIKAASFKGADLTEVELLETELGAIDFESARAPGLTFLPGLDLTKCRFPRATLTKTNFLECALGGVDFSDAILELVTFLKVAADGANFGGSDLRRFHAVAGCSFRNACFKGANLENAFLRGADLRGADFEGASLDGADLSECLLAGANLSRIRARDTMFVRADLTGANLRGADLLNTMLQKSTLHGADLRDTNLFAANLAQIRVDTATQNKNANLKRALMFPKREARS